MNGNETDRFTYSEQRVPERVSAIEAKSPFMASKEDLANLRTEMEAIRTEIETVRTDVAQVRTDFSDRIAAHWKWTASLIGAAAIAALTGVTSIVVSVVRLIS